MKTSFYLIIFLFLFLSCKTDNLKESCDEQIISNQLEKNCVPQIMAYHFGVENLPVSEQITTLSDLQMDGMITQIETANFNDLDKYYNHCRVKNGLFHIYNVFTTVSCDNSEMNKEQLKTIEKIYAKVQYHNTLVLVLFDGEKNSHNLTNAINKVSEIATKYNNDLVIYPHEGLAIETAEEALSHINALNKTNIFLSVHLCHELAAGNDPRISEIINLVAPYLKAVSISGATTSEKNNENLPLWYWGIKPLNMGTYDYSTFYKTLYEVNYKGPIALHTWGIFDNFKLTVQEHLPHSREIITNMHQQLCEKNHN